MLTKQKRNRYLSVWLIILPLFFSNMALAINGEEFEQLITGKTVDLYHNKKDKNFRRYFATDGTLLHLSPKKGLRKGNWYIDGNDLCFDLGSSSTKCRPIMEEDGEYGTGNKKGTRLRVIYSGFEQGNTLNIPVQQDSNTPTGQAYQGEISDFHSHVKVGMPLDMIVELMNNNRIDKALLMRRDSIRFSTGGKLLTTNEELITWQQQHPQRIILGNGMQLSTWRNQLPALAEKVSRQAASGKFRLIGEIVLHGGQGSGSISPASPLLDKIVAIAAQYQLPVLIHQFHQNDEDEQQFLQLFNRYPQVTFIWAHMCGFSAADKIRRLFKHYPRLHCDLAWLPKKKRMADKGIVDKEFNFTPEWKSLLEDNPTRFFIGVDLTTKEDYESKYSTFIGRFRKALGGLSTKTAQQIATENFKRNFIKTQQ